MAQKWIPFAIALCAVAAFLVLAIGDITGSSPTYDEPVHLAAGWSYLATGDYRLNPEHPPLLKMFAAAAGGKLWPAGMTNAADGTQSFSSLQEMWDLALTNKQAQWFFSHHLLYSLRDSALQRLGTTVSAVPTTVPIPRGDFLNDTERTFFRARLALLLLSGLGLAAIIFSWSYELWGAWGAALSVTFFAFDPNFIAHAGLVTTDAGVSFFFAGTLYFFWRASRALNAVNAIVFALFFAAAMLAKFSAVLLLPMLVLIIVTVGRKQWMRLSALAAGALLVGVIAIWSAYGFRSMPVAKPFPIRDVAARIGFVGKAVLFADRANLLPHPYLYGFAAVQESTINREAYLRGEFSQTGFRSYFFWTFLYKTPIPTIVAILAGLFVAWRRRKQHPGVWFVLLPAIVYLAVAIVATINIGHRHLLPIYPFLYVLCGALPRKFFIASALAVVACFWSFNAPMWGQHLAYINELGGGPRNGSKVLLDSNLDWGQDLARLRTWLDEHHVAEPVNLVYFGSPDPRYHGIRFLNLQLGYYAAPEVPLDQARVPGWVAISANDLAGGAIPEDRFYWRQWLDSHHAKLAGMAGSSIFVYRIE